MILKSKNGSSFSLSLEAMPMHMRPLPGRKSWDEWLQIWMAVRCPQGSWKVLDECLLLYEAEKLSQWFKAVAEGQPVEKKITFLEPNLGFTRMVTTANPIIRVTLMAEMRPPWGDGSDFELDLEVSADDLALEAQRFKEELYNYTRR